MAQEHNPSEHEVANEAATEGQDAVEQPEVGAQEDQTAQADVGELGIWGDRITSLEAEVAELKEQALRAQAEAQNTRRRADEEVSKARKFAVEGFAESLLPVLDSLEAGLAVEDATLEQIREGADATLRQLVAALERNKVVAVAPAQGETFDPNVHQAISVVPTPEGVELPPNSVVTVLQKGYTMAERVLRPALVMVTAA